MTISLVRHGKAGDRARWSAPDRLRPLDADGRAQAAGLVGSLGNAGIQRIVSSPYVRCLQTVEPLAASLGLRVETNLALAEGSGYEEVARLFASMGDANAVLCTHGDVIGMVLDRLVHDGVPIHKPLRLKKGSTWMLETGPDGLFRSARYLPPP